jgi:tRNA G46 methylase TrmB
MSKSMEANVAMTAVRCENLSSLSGRVLEIGPGTGANFACFGKNTDITAWVGIEPNIYMQQQILEKVKEMNPPFPTSLVTASAADKLMYAMQQEEPFDYVRIKQN